MERQMRRQEEQDEPRNLKSWIYFVQFGSVGAKHLEFKEYLVAKMLN